MTSKPVQQHQGARRHSSALMVPLIALALLAAACGGSDKSDAAAASGVIPASVDDTCPVPSATFASWFDSGTPSADGPVSAADSVGFPTTNTVCDFYTWGAQMFLWLTSPEGDGLVLDGPSIFTVAPAVNNERTLIANTDDANYVMALRSAKTDDIGELGQAGGGGVLMSQGESLVFHGVSGQVHPAQPATRRSLTRATSTPLICVARCMRSTPPWRPISKAPAASAVTR